MIFFLLALCFGQGTALNGTFCQSPQSPSPLMNATLLGPCFNTTLNSTSPQTCQFTCNGGFELINSSTTTCEPNGTWTLHGNCTGCLPGFYGFNNECFPCDKAATSKFASSKCTCNELYNGSGGICFFQPAWAASKDPEIRITIQLFYEINNYTIFSTLFIQDIVRAIGPNITAQQISILKANLTEFNSTTNVTQVQFQIVPVQQLDKPVNKTILLNYVYSFYEQMLFANSTLRSQGILTANINPFFFQVDLFDVLLSLLLRLPLSTILEVLLALTVFIVLFFFINRYYFPKAANGRVVSLWIGGVSFAANLTLVSFLAPLPQLNWAFLFVVIPLLVPIGMNVLALGSTLFSEAVLNKEFREWYYKHRLVTGVFFIFSLTNTKHFRCLDSGILGLNIFSAPLGKKIIYWSGFFSIVGTLIGDLPLIIAQITVSINLGSFQTSNMIALVPTALNLLNNLSGPILLTLLFSYKKIWGCFSKVASDAPVSIEAATESLEDPSVVASKLKDSLTDGVSVSIDEVSRLSPQVALTSLKDAEAQLPPVKELADSSYLKAKLAGVEEEAEPLTKEMVSKAADKASGLGKEALTAASEKSGALAKQALSKAETKISQEVSSVNMADVKSQVERKVVQMTPTVTAAIKTEVAELTPYAVERLKGVLASVPVPTTGDLENLKVNVEGKLTEVAPKISASIQAGASKLAPVAVTELKKVADSAPKPTTQDLNVVKDRIEVKVTEMAPTFTASIKGEVSQLAPVALSRVQKLSISGVPNTEQISSLGQKAGESLLKGAQNTGEELVSGVGSLSKVDYKQINAGTISSEVDKVGTKISQAGVHAVASDVGKLESKITTSLSAPRGSGLGADSLRKLSTEVKSENLTSVSAKLGSEISSHIDSKALLNKVSSKLSGEEGAILAKSKAELLAIQNDPSIVLTPLSEIKATAQSVAQNNPISQADINWVKSGVSSVTSEMKNITSQIDGIETDIEKKIEHQLAQKAEGEAKSYIPLTGAQQAIILNTASQIRAQEQLEKANNPDPPKKKSKKEKEKEKKENEKGFLSSMLQNELLSK